MPTVLDELTTLQTIADNRMSVARFGDGEISLCLGRGVYFQRYDPILSDRLKTVLSGKSQERFMVCLAPHTHSSYTLLPKNARFVYRFFARRKKEYFQLLNPNKTYGSAYISRPDIFVLNEKQLNHYIALIKMLWQDRDVTVVTGKESRFSTDSDVFDNINSISMLYTLSENAFSEYDSLLSQIYQLPKDRLILLALGPTATVLASDLSNAGYQAIDIGHLPGCVDIAQKNIIKRPTSPT